MRKIKVFGYQFFLEENIEKAVNSWVEQTGNKIIAITHAHESEDYGFVIVVYEPR